MPFEVVEEYFEGAVKLIRNRIFEDDRGFFQEVYRYDHFAQLGITDAHFIQDNHSRSAIDVVRGLHFQFDQPMAKLMRVTVGKAILVAVDIRKGSPTVGQSIKVQTEASEGLQLFAPASFARGFRTLSDFVEIQYKCTAVYNPAGESGIRWNDPDIDLDWGIAEPHLSKRDASAQSFAEWLDSPQSDVFAY